jgi:hypothetical protein
MIESGLLARRSDSNPGTIILVSHFVIPDAYASITVV